MPSVYIAAMYSWKERCKKFVEELQTRIPQIEISSSWLKEAYAPHTTMDMLDDEELSRTGLRDFTEVLRSDIMIFFSNPPDVPTIRGGRHVEFGIALASSVLICVIGPKENIFHYVDLPDIKHFTTEEACMSFLEEYVSCHL
jgi:hypothetical protein